ncbi:VanZ family protein [Paenibacillus sp. YPG26]|uniref:VanZ family protein n=1 Tax=Paenibacillus sp. YPG26 TaxID=2878915 RepID=UPI00203E1DB0|nr:VanZ family protein [Paenibacillus sp. YPG26]USB33120.1 VanZ family protein [Paenibacillus sp. YPG26]
MDIRFTLQSGYVLIPLFVLALIALYGLYKYKRWRLTVPQLVLLITFSLYLMAVLHLVFFPIEVNIGRYANLTPWYSTVNYIPLLTLDIRTFVLNIVMFVPLGMYLPLLNSRMYSSVARTAKLALFLSLSIELVQLLIRITLGSGRSTDINDLIANTLGGVLGCILLSKLMQWNWMEHRASRLRLQ